MAEFVTVGKVDEVAEGASKGFSVNGAEIAVARSAGTLYAFGDICTHRGCNLSMGEIEGSTITCRRGPRGRAGGHLRGPRGGRRPPGRRLRLARLGGFKGRC